MEIWKDVKGYEGIYQISNYGRLKEIIQWNPGKHIWETRERILTPSSNGRGGYMLYGLRKDKKRKNHYIHRMVAEAFLDNPNNYPVVNHIDYNRKNNKVENLEWCTQLYNNRHSSCNMRKPRPSAPLGAVGERYICYRKSKNEYRVIIHLKEYGVRKTLEEAIELRNKILRENKYVDVDSL